MIQIKLMTNKLKNELNVLKDKYETGEKVENRRDKQLFETMREETAPLFDLIDSWSELTIDAIRQGKTHVHDHQIISTQDNYHLLILHSYYVDIRRRPYMNLYRSSLYVFDQLLKGIEVE